jgi:uncharacterized protein DUF4260
LPNGTKFNRRQSSIMTLPRILLHLEGAIVLLLSIFFYFNQGGSWILFALLILAPDLAMLGYLAGPRIGSVVYNAVHIYVWPAALIAFWLLANHLLALQLALIWAAHIGADRMLGSGLKYPSAFKDTHLQRV